jgi:hypothetical protein
MICTPSLSLNEMPATSSNATTSHSPTRPTWRLAANVFAFDDLPHPGDVCHSGPDQRTEIVGLGELGQGLPERRGEQVAPDHIHIVVQFTGFEPDRFQYTDVGLHASP